MLRDLAKRLDIDRPVAYALAARSWQVPAGLVNILLYVKFFTPEAQGVYYTFFSLLGLQTFVELAFFQVIIVLASHEWSRLDLDSRGRITGDAQALSRLASLGRFAFKWYAVAGLIFLVLVGSTGLGFFSDRVPAHITWRPQWIAVVVLNSILLAALPFLSILEGCNQVRAINAMRLVQAILGSFSLWIALVSGGGLWAIVASAGTNLAVALFCLWRYRRFFGSFFEAPGSGGLHWLTEIWPMQWRLAILGLVNYFLYSLFTPIMFAYHGPVVAGQMGLTNQLVTMLGVVAFTWMQTQIPSFGRLAAIGNNLELDRLWQRKMRVCAIVFVLGASVLWLAVYALNAVDSGVASRMLSPSVTGVFLIAGAAMLGIQCMATYLRTFKQEPLFVPGVVTSLLTGVLVWQLGMTFGAIGAAIGYFAAIMLVAVPWDLRIWRKERRVRLGLQP